MIIDFDVTKQLSSFGIEDESIPEFQLKFFYALKEAILEYSNFINLSKERNYFVHMNGNIFIKNKSNKFKCFMQNFQSLGIEMSSSINISKLSVKMPANLIDDLKNLCGFVKSLFAKEVFLNDTKDYERFVAIIDLLPKQIRECECITNLVEKMLK